MANQDGTQIYYFALSSLIPPEEESWRQVQSGDFLLVRRKWDANEFDFATLGSSHDLSFPWGMLTYLHRDVSVEIGVYGQASREEAEEKFSILRLMLYANHISPFLVRFVSTHSLNEWCGINARDAGRDPPDMQEALPFGITSKDATIVMRLGDAAYQATVLPSKTTITEKAFYDSVALTKIWHSLESQNNNLRTVRLAATDAPLVHERSASILLIWEGIEALFPDLNAELRFRLSLLLAQLSSPVADRGQEYKRIKESYNQRSKITHGRIGAATTTAWGDAWIILMMAVLSIVRRRKMPSQQELLEELLDSRG